MKINSLFFLTCFSSSELHMLFCNEVHDLKVRLSTSHKASVDGQFPPRFARVLRSVMYVPPNAGSLILAKNAITATNMLYSATCLKKK